MVAGFGRFFPGAGEPWDGGFSIRETLCTRLVFFFLVGIRARQVEMEEEESEGEEDAGPFKVFGTLRLPLKPGTASGYVPWACSASLPRSGRGRLL